MKSKKPNPWREIARKLAKHVEALDVSREKLAEWENGRGRNVGRRMVRDLEQFDKLNKL